MYYFKLNICNACRILESRSFEHVPFIHFPFGPVRDLIEAAEKRSLEALQKLIKGVHPPGRDKCIPLFVSLVLLFGYYNDARKFWARFGAQNGKPQENLASRLCQQILGMYKVLFSAGNPLEFDWTAKDKLDLLGGNRELASQLQTFCGDARHYRIGKLSI